MGKVEDRLRERGLVLPAPLQLPPGMELPFPEVNIRARRAVISGASALEEDGRLAAPFGKVGSEVSVEEGYRLAKLTGLCILAGLKRELGELDRITGWVRVFGMVNSAPGFTEQPAVINGFSHLILDLFGPETGRHARSAVGMAALPMNIAVEIEGEVLFD
jgi:enamine deaminase RidA (YjgF/YER057c/UK114 family)